MSRLWIAAAALALGGASVARAAEPVRDCPLATAPLGLASPLADVLLHPGGRAALDSVAPGLVGDFTKNFGGGDLPPGFAAILTPAVLIEARPGGAALRAAVAANLAALPIDDAFTVARCARTTMTGLRCHVPTGAGRFWCSRRSTAFATARRSRRHIGACRRSALRAVGKWCSAIAAG